MAIDWSSIYNYFVSLLSGIVTQLVIAVIIVIMGFILGKIVGKIVQKVLHELELNKILHKAGVKISLEDIISSFVAYFIYFIAIIMALSQLGIMTIALHLISAGAILLIIVATLLAIKDFIPNAVAGFFIYRRDLFKEGDSISVRNITGKVLKKDLLETRIKTTSGDIIYIPNSTLTKSELRIKKKK